MILAPGETIGFTVAYSPTGIAATEVATIRIITNNATAPFVDVLVTSRLGTGKIAKAIANGGDFGDVSPGRFADELLTINNSGTCLLTIFDMTSSLAEFQVPSVLSYPLNVSPGVRLL